MSPAEQQLQEIHEYVNATILEFKESESVGIFGEGYRAAFRDMKKMIDDAENGYTRRNGGNPYAEGFNALHSKSEPDQLNPYGPYDANAMALWQRGWSDAYSWGRFHNDIKDEIDLIQQSLNAIVSISKAAASRKEGKNE